MTFTDSTDTEPTTFASGIEDGQGDVTGPVDAAEVERILAEQYGIEVTPTLPTDTAPPADGLEPFSGSRIESPTTDPTTEPSDPAAPQDDGSRPGPSAEGEASIPSPSAPSPGTRVDPDTGVPIESPMDRIVAESPPPEGDAIIVEGPTPGVDAPATAPPAPTPTPAPTPSAPPAGSFSADEFLAAVFGSVDETLVRGTADMVQRYQQLPPAYREIVDDLFSGRVPQALQQPAPTYAQPAPTPTPAPQPTAPTSYDPWLDDGPPPATPAPTQPVVDPALAAQIEQTRRELEDLRAVEAARIQREVTQAADAAAETIRARYPELTEAEIAGVAYAVNQSGYVTNGLAQGYDPRQVWEQTAEQLIWTNPSLRPKAIASQAQLPVTAVPRATPIPERDEATETERRAKAAAVSGGSGVAQSPLTSLTPPGEPAPPTDAAGRRGWSVDQIADMLKGLQSDTQ